MLGIIFLFLKSKYCVLDVGGPHISSFSVHNSPFNDLRPQWFSFEPFFSGSFETCAPSHPRYVVLYYCVQILPTLLSNLLPQTLWASTLKFLSHSTVLTPAVGQGPHTKTEDSKLCQDTLRKTHLF